MPNKVRIDKWLWAIRLYKTRSMATDACRSGRVKVDEKSVKASFSIEVGTKVSINKREKKWVVVCHKLIEKRVGAEIAKECYEDFSPPTIPTKGNRAFFYSRAEIREKGTGRPTKKERRILDEFKDEEEE